MADDVATAIRELTEPWEVEPDEKTAAATVLERATESSAADADTSGGDAGAEADGIRPRADTRLALLVGSVLLAVLAGVVGWLGFRAHVSHQSSEQRELFLRVGRQGAVNLTTIDYAHIDTDVQRILDSSTGAFNDDFKKRSPDFVAVMSQTKAKSEGAVAEAGIESEDDKQAQVLVAVSVKTSTAEAPQQEPRSWRMRISVAKVGNDAKVSDVKFIP